MTHDLQALARRAITCKGWRWMPGMLNGEDGSRYMGALYWAWQDPYRHHAQGMEIDDWPDLADPATRGCLLALVREAHEDWGINPVCVSDLGPANGWRCWPARGHYPSEAAALVAALEAAPCD